MQRNRAKPNSKTHHGRAPHRQKQPGAPRKGKEQRKTKNSREHSSTQQQNTRKTAEQDPAQHRARQRGARNQPKTSTPHSTGQTTQHTTDRSTTRNDADHAQHRAPHPAGGGGSTTSTHKQKQRTASGRGARRETPHGTPQQGKKPHQRDLHNTHQGKGKQHDKSGRNRPTPPQHQRATTGRKCCRTGQEDGAHKHGTRGSTGKRNTARTVPPDKCNTTGNNTQTTGRTWKHQTTQRKRKLASTGAQRLQQHTPAHPTAQDPQTTPAARNRRSTAKKKEAEKKRNKLKTNARQKNRGGGGAKRKGKRKKRGGGRRDNKTPRPKALRAGKHRMPETTETHKRKKTKHSNNHKQGNPSPEGAEQTKSAPGPAGWKGEADQNAPGRPACPTRPREARTRTHAWDPGVASSDLKRAGVGVRTKQPRCGS